MDEETKKILARARDKGFSCELVYLGPEVNPAGRSQFLRISQDGVHIIEISLSRTEAQMLCDVLRAGLVLKSEEGKA